MHEKNTVAYGKLGSCYVQPCIKELKVGLLYKLRATIGTTETLGN